MNGRLTSSLRLHLLFATDDVAHIDAPTDLIHLDGEAADAAFINIALLDAFLGHSLRNLLLCHPFFLSS